MFSKPFLLTVNVVGRRVLSENCSTRAMHREYISATHANRPCNSEPPQVEVCLGGGRTVSLVREERTSIENSSFLG